MTSVNLFRKIDALFLNKTEVACHKIQKQTGATNYLLAGIVCLLMAGTVVSMVLREAITGSAAKVPPFLRGVRGVVVFDQWLHVGIVVLLLTYAFWLWAFEETRAFERLTQGFANPQKASTGHQVVRLLLLFSVASLLPKSGLSLESSFMVLFCVWRLLEACDPLPPCRGKLWEKIEAFWGHPSRRNSP